MKAKLVLLNFPPNSSLKVDFYAFQSKPELKGIENLDPGIHFVNYNDQTIFLDLQSINVVDAALNYSHFDPSGSIIGGNKLNQSSKETLSVFKFSEVLEKPGFFITIPAINLSLDSSLDGLIVTPTSTSYLTDVINKYQQKDLNDLNSDFIARPTLKYEIPFTEIVFKRIGTTPAEITANRTTDKLLEDILTRKSVHNLVQELNFSFVLLYIAENIDGFEQFKRLLQLFLNSTKTFAVLYRQLQVVLEYFDELLEDYDENFVLDLVYNHGFYAHGQEWEELLEFLEDRFGWSLKGNMGLELGEECPVIVGDVCNRLEELAYKSDTGSDDGLSYTVPEIGKTR